MDAIGSILSSIAGRDNSAPGDYVDDAGFLICGKCRTRKQCAIEFPGDSEKRKVSCSCHCMREAQEVEAEGSRREEFRQRVQRLRRDGLTDPEYLAWIFAADDQRQPELSDTCRRYVDNWAQMKADNNGLLFYGGVGTGKSFYACCIANALLERCVPSLVTNFPRILNKIQSAKWGDDRNSILGRLQRYDLVVIDDLGVERSTDYAMEQIYNVIDTRYRSGKPLIVTTNLAPADIKNPENIGYSRIYDRILQNCVPVKITGPSRRVEIADAKRKRFQSILGLSATESESKG